MATINQGNKHALHLPAGQILTVTADANSSGKVWKLPDSAGGGAPLCADIEAGATETFGPYTTPARLEIVPEANFLTYSIAPADLQALKLGTGTTLEAAPTREGAGSFQPIAVDLNLDADAGTSEEGETDFLAPMMSNLLGENLTKENVYLAGLIGALSVLGTRATVLPMAAVLGILMDGSINADAIVQAHIDGGDPSTQTNARAAFGVSQFNNHEDSGVEYGLDLMFEPGSEIDALLSDTAKPFKITKAIIRAPGGWCLLIGDGAPVNGTTGDNFAAKGSIYVDYTTPDAYINAGTITDSVWKQFTRAE